MPKAKRCPNAESEKRENGAGDVATFFRINVYPVGSAFILKCILRTFLVF